MRKQNLGQLLARRPDGIFAAPFELGEIGPNLCRAACNMGLKGMVSKRPDRPYRAGRSKEWVNVKNREHPAYRRVRNKKSPPPLDSRPSAVMKAAHVNSNYAVCGTKGPAPICAFANSSQRKYRSLGGNALRPHKLRSYCVRSVFRVPWRLPRTR
jgi:hypothetical protein